MHAPFAALHRGREMVGEFLGIGYGNGNAMLKKLNTFGITREDFESAVAKAKER